MENKFYKVAEEGGTFVTGEFYNPITGEHKHEVLRDYDYADCSRDNDELYYMPIDEEVRHIWLNSRGIICKGDRVQVIKGRTIPHGTTAQVKDKRDYTDKYGRWIATYLYFEDGRKINEANCELIRG